MLCFYAAYELEEMRTVFEDIGTQEPKKIWESLLRLARDFTGAMAVQGYTFEGEPGERISENPTPADPGLREAVQFALSTGQRERIGNIFVLPILSRQRVLGAVALEIASGHFAADHNWRLESVFFFAGMFFRSCSSAA